MILTWSLVTGSAAQAADCPQPYTIDEVLGEIVVIEAGLRQGDDPAASAGAERLQAGLACLQDVLPLVVVGRSYRAIGAGLIVGGSVDRGTGWLRVAAEVEQTFAFGLRDIPASHPVRQAYNEAKLSSSGPLAETDWVFPQGTAFLDGREIELPMARPDRPHLLQIRDDTLRSWVIEGAVFPSEVLVPAVVAPEPEPVAPSTKSPKPEKVAKAPKEPKPEKVTKERKDKAVASSQVTLQAKRERPGEKTPLILAGAALGGAAGGLYYVSGRKRAAFDDAATEGEAVVLQQQVNRLVIASAALFAVGTGTFSWGVILDGGAPLPAVRIRF